MRGDLIIIGTGIVFAAAGVFLLWQNARQLARLSVVWRLNESSVMSLPAGEVVKVTGEIEQHPAAELLPVPFATTGSDCAYRKWTVEEGHWWSHVADGSDGVPALLSNDGNRVRVDMQTVEAAFLDAYDKNPQFFGEGDHNELEAFLSANSDYETEDGGAPTRRGRASVVEPGDEVTIIGRTRHTTDAKDPARITIADANDDDDSGFITPSGVIVTDWSMRRLATATGFRVFGLLYGAFVTATGGYIIAAEYVTGLGEDVTPVLMLISLVIGIAYLYGKDIRLRLHGDTVTEE